MNLSEQIKNIIATVSIVSPEEIKSDDPLSSIGIDSLAAVELIVELEDAFGIIFDISDLDPEQLTTVGSAIELTEKYIKKEA